MSREEGNPIIKGPTAVTQANMKISAVDGTAFVDFSASAFSADNIRNNDFVEIFDSAKRKIGGFIKAAGTGETFGSELITNGDFSSVSIIFGTPSGSFAAGDMVSGGTSLATGTFVSVGGGILVLSGVSGTFAAGETITGVPSGATGVITIQRPTGWTVDACTPTIVADGQVGTCLSLLATSTGGSGGVLRPVSVNNKGLYIESVYIKNGSAASKTLSFWLAPTHGNIILYATGAAWSLRTAYRTIIQGNGNIYAAYYGSSENGKDVLVDEFSFKQVLTPSSTGVTITNAPGGATYNWGVKDANFNYNDASGYTYHIISRQAYGTLILNQETVSGTLHLATVDGGAMFFHDSVDFSTYAGDDAGVTPYELVFEDAAGKCAMAYAAAQGGGESLDSELVANGTAWTGATGTTPPTGWNTASGKVGVHTITDSGDGAPYDVCLKLETNNPVQVYPTTYCNSTVSVGALYKESTAYKKGTAPICYISIGSTSGGFDYHNNAHNNAAWATYTKNFTAKTTTASVGLVGSNDQNTAGLFSLFDTVSLKKYLDIPTTGLHLVSAMGGTTRNMKSVDAGFDSNQIVKVRVYRTGQTDTTAGALLDDAGLFLLDDAGAILTED
jgi:hypothetical protein